VSAWGDMSAYLGTVIISFWRWYWLNCWQTLFNYLFNFRIRDIIIKQSHRHQSCSRQDISDKSLIGR